MSFETIVSITPAFEGKITYLNLIVAEAHGFLFIHYAGLSDGIVFKVHAENYFIQLSFTTTHVHLQRNDKLIVVPLAEEDRSNVFICEFSWSPSSFGLYVKDKEGGHRGHTVETVNIFPPNSLKTWARQHAILPETKFRSQAHFFDVLIAQLQNLNDKIHRTDGKSGFWNITYDGSSIISRKPKRETDIHPTIRLLLDDLEFIKNFQILPEHPTAGGRLDFLITAPLDDGTTAKACVEFKLSHSQDIASGLTRQLPAYMDSVGTDLGIYAVLDFGPDYPMRTSQFTTSNFDSTDAKPDTILQLAANNTGRRFLRTVIFSVGPTQSPSRL